MTAPSADPTPPPRPTDLDKAAAAKDVNDCLNHYITMLDGKATAFLAGNVGAATFLLNHVPDHGWVRTLFVASLVLFAISTVVAGGVIFPRLPQRGNSVLYWGDIARHGDVRSYQQDFQRVMDCGTLDEEYTAQNFYAARVLLRKYHWLRWAIVLFGLAIFAGFGVYLSS